MTLLMKSVTVAEVKRRFSEVLGSVRYQGERLIVMRRRQPMAAIVPLEDLHKLQALERQTSGGGSPRGLLAAIGAWEDYNDLDQLIVEIYEARDAAASRRVEYPS